MELGGMVSSAFNFQQPAKKMKRKWLNIFLWSLRVLISEGTDISPQTYPVSNVDINLHSSAPLQGQPHIFCLFCFHIVDELLEEMGKVVRCRGNVTFWYYRKFRRDAWKSQLRIIALAKLSDEDEAYIS